jgi:Domain of unknown function (DUF1707)/Cell wall-active antibiotics response 4TMS YvqF
MSDLELDRERVIQTLCTHFANDNLSTEELELRCEHAYKAGSSAELRALVAGLPALPPEVAGSTPMYGVAPAGRTEPEEKRHVVIMSTIRKKGQWTPARYNKVVCLMGNAKFDLREALLLHGETHFELNIVMGEVELLVPPGLRVECDGTAFMGEFDDSHSEGFAPPDAPVIRVTGSVLMGAARIKTRLPGESSLEAWRRRRLEA